MLKRALRSRRRWSSAPRVGSSGSSRSCRPQRHRHGRPRGQGGRPGPGPACRRPATSSAPAPPPPAAPSSGPGGRPPHCCRHPQQPRRSRRARRTPAVRWWPSEKALRKRNVAVLLGSKALRQAIDGHEISLQRGQRRLRRPFSWPCLASFSSSPLPGRLGSPRRRAPAATWPAWPAAAATRPPGPERRRSSMRSASWQARFGPFSACFRRFRDVFCLFLEVFGPVRPLLATLSARTGLRVHADGQREV